MDAKMPTKNQMTRARGLMDAAQAEMRYREARGELAHDEDFWTMFWSAWGPVCIYAAMPKSGYTDADHARRTLDDAMEVVELSADRLVSACPQYRDAIMRTLEVE